ncbi:MAG TPA: winged helix-turn-helix domain-containing protein [Pyrinomonadaceae bacterium]|nr:winged helix-turn-helix domain-containing protein [Pyrinomonadaceae bacterium]
MDKPHIFEFGQFHLDVTQRTLLRNGEPVPLKPKAFDLLVVLVENRHSVVSKEDLMRRVWPDSEVEENNLTVQKRALVSVLGEGYIQTVPRRGYRFVADVREETGSGKAESRVPVVQQGAASETLTDGLRDAYISSPALPAQELGSEHVAKTLSSWKRPALIGFIVLLSIAGLALIWKRVRESQLHVVHGRVQVRSPSDEAEVMRVVKESQIYETLGIYVRPETFDQSQLDKYWLPAEKGGKAVTAVQAAVERLRKRGWRYADDSRMEIFDFRYVRIFSPRDYAEVGTSERWYVPTVWANDGKRVENRNVYLGTYDVDYILQRVEGRWLLEENSTPRPWSGSNQNK